jgi:hypothetical protein
MPYKDPKVKNAYELAYRKEYYLLNRDETRARVAKNKRAGRERWIEFKANQPCHHCGASHPAIIDFHHIVRDGTQQSVNRMAANNRWKGIYEEVKKCIPLCANCHRILHWNESRKLTITKSMPTRILENTDDDNSSAA